MSDAKSARIAQAAAEAKAREQKHLLSLRLCLSRADVMRHHHDALIREAELANDPAYFTDAKKTRFFAYIAFWFTALCGAIERYEQLREKGAVPRSPKVDALLTESFKDLLKPFRNSVAHCSDHDDKRTLEIFDHEKSLPDQAMAISYAFHKYFEEHLRAVA